MPKKSKKKKKLHSCQETVKFLEVVHELRQKCPWDKKQTHASLSRYLLEEAYEAVETMNPPKRESLKEELGDVLLQVALHSEIASEKKWFDFEEVAKSISEKMIRRHPHVFSNVKVKDAKAVVENWSKLKQKEKPKKKIMEGIPKAPPSLQLAQRYGEIASSVGFDWTRVKEVMAKVKEELSELEHEIESAGSLSKVEEELGDLLFTLAQLGRHLGVDSERSLRTSNTKFLNRFEKLEKRLRSQGKQFTDLSEKALEREWQAIKRYVTP